MKRPICERRETPKNPRADPFALGPPSLLPIIKSVDGHALGRCPDRRCDTSTGLAASVILANGVRVGHCLQTTLLAVKAPENVESRSRQIWTNQPETAAMVVTC